MGAEPSRGRVNAWLEIDGFHITFFFITKENIFQLNCLMGVQ